MTVQEVTERVADYDYSDIADEFLPQMLRDAQNQAAYLKRHARWQRTRQEAQEQLRAVEAEIQKRGLGDGAKIQLDAKVGPAFATPAGDADQITLD